MQCSVELPLGILQYRKELDYDFVIASHFLSVPDYALEYTRKDASRFVILDNGAFETGKSIPHNEYFQIIEKVSPNVIVLPDVVNNASETMQKSSLFLREFYGTTYASNIIPCLMGVLQGESTADYMECLKFYRGIPHVSIIGIPYHLFYRPKFIAKNNINEICKEAGLQIHILGLPNPTEALELKKFSQVKSVDTSLPVVSGIHNLRFQDLQWVSDRVPIEKIDFFSAQKVAILSNIRTLSEWCKS